MKVDWMLPCLLGHEGSQVRRWIYYTWPMGVLKYTQVLLRGKLKLSRFEDFDGLRRSNWQGHKDIRCCFIQQ